MPELRRVCEGVVELRPDPADRFESWFGNREFRGMGRNERGGNRETIAFDTLDEATTYMRQTHVSWEVRGSVSSYIYASKDYGEHEWRYFPVYTPYQPEPETGEQIHVITARITRPNGRLTLEINAKEFHDTLDSIGVRNDGLENGMYLDRPETAVAVADAARFVMSTNCLLKREYPAKYDLTGLWTNPPKFDSLKALCESAYTQARKILDHYQPIDISIDIQKKIVK